MNQFVIAAAFAALLMGWTVSVVALQITDDTQAPIVQNIERQPTACEQFEAATAFLADDPDMTALVLTAAGEAMGVTPPSPDLGTNTAAAEAARRLGQMLLLCTAETKETAR